MIGFDSIGTMGRLGNQMFQHAAVKGIARKHGYEYSIPVSYTHLTLPTTLTV